MTKKSFIATEKAIGHEWWDALEESMKEAAEEEKRNAIEQGSLHEGVPAISVIFDGGWSKRSHKHSYNAKSGTSIIIGVHTGKLLHVGVRNKYCSVCVHTHSNIILNHKNMTVTRTGMVHPHRWKLTYLYRGSRRRRLSTVYDTLLSLVTATVLCMPAWLHKYWGHVIRKVECANHAIKCYRGALERLVTEKPHYKGRGKLTVAIRKCLTTAARCAIKMRSA